MKIQYKDLLSILKKKYAGAGTGLFTNQVSFDITMGKYLSQLLSGVVDLKKIFIPEHGFFAELQDQLPVSNVALYNKLAEEAEFVPLYGRHKDLIGILSSEFDHLELLIIDIQDIGSRYYTYVTMIARMLEVVTVRKFDVDILVIDRPNPAGRQVEGTPLEEEFASVIGWHGILHRYGLTIGELSRYFMLEMGSSAKLHVLTMDAREMEHPDLPVYPSPNVPWISTAMVFPGQCLWEGTNVSEGRGTTRPFEIFGAPFFNRLTASWSDRWNQDNTEAVLRPLAFKSVFHKYSDQLCYGFQLHPVGRSYHSLYYTLKMMRELKQVLPEIEWRPVPYEQDSNKLAIELLTGDSRILKYLDGAMGEKELLESMDHEERRWIEKASDILLYKDKLYQAGKE